MKKLFSLKLISHNPRTFVSHTIRSNNSFCHYTGYVEPFLLKRLLPDGFLKWKASNKLFVDYGKFESLRAQCGHNFQYNQKVGYQNKWFSKLRRRLTTNGVVLGLILTNVGVFLLWRNADRKFMIQNFMIQLDNVKSGRFHTMITSAFSHYEGGHIVSNMIGLIFFGNSIGHQFGPEFLLKLYLAGAFVGSVFFLVHHAFLVPSSKERRLNEPDPSKVSGLGASGAVNAIMLLDIFLNPKQTIYVYFVLPVPAFLLGIFLVGHDMMKMLKGNSRNSGSAHLGGAAVAAIAWARLRKGRLI